MSTTNPERRRPRILVAEDDPELLVVLVQALQYLGAEVVRAETGAALVLSLAERGPFDLVITDIFMPWMDGLRAMASMRSAGITTPILFVTGMSDGDLPGQVAALGEGAALLRKPFELVELETAVVRLLGSPEEAGGEQPHAHGPGE